MKGFLSRNWTTLALVGTLMLAVSTGYFAAVALGVGQQAPTRTVTIDVGTGAKGEPGAPGPPGAKGDPGSPGAENCPTGSTFTAVVINTPGGHTTLWTCVQN